MATGPMTKVLDHLRRSMPPPADGSSDGQLLDDFVARRDEAAFAALVRRHGPMVLGVCRRVVGHRHDAEDAFQATFLVLARKAASVSPRHLVGNWLYGVAYRTALEARRRTHRLHAREQQVSAMPHPLAPAEPDGHELQSLLDQELSRLPEKYRVPVVLCELQSRPRKEVAKQLRLAEGTLSSRLAAARKMLARRLARHGLAFSTGGLALEFSVSNASAAVSPELVLAAVRAATAPAANAVPTPVASLAEGVMKAMFLSKLNVLKVVVVILVLAGTAAGVAVLPGLEGGQSPARAQDTARPAAPAAGALAALKKARSDAARKAFNAVWEQYRMGWHDEEQVYRWSVRVLQAQRQAAANKAARLQAFAAHLHRMKELEQTAPDRMVAETRSPPLGSGKEKFRLTTTKDGSRVAMMVADLRPQEVAVVLTAFYRAEAEVWLTEAKAR
jgi:RNA polymerase sigma factor (sigma-70 family)